MVLGQARRWPCAVAVALLGLAACQAGSSTSARQTPSPPSATAPAPPSADPAVVAAGDIGSCDSGGDEATAGLVDHQPGTVLTLGDTVYEQGTAADFARCYAPTWGRFKARTKPAPGNHDY